MRCTIFGWVATRRCSDGSADSLQRSSAAVAATPKPCSTRQLTARVLAPNPGSRDAGALDFRQRGRATMRPLCSLRTGVGSRQRHRNQQWRRRQQPWSLLPLLLCAALRHPCAATSGDLGVAAAAPAARADGVATTTISASGASGAAEPAELFTLQVDNADAPSGPTIPLVVREGEENPPSPPLLLCEAFGRPGPCCCCCCVGRGQRRDLGAAVRVAPRARPQDHRGARTGHRRARQAPGLRAPALRDAGVQAAPPPPPAPPAPPPTPHPSTTQSPACSCPRGGLQGWRRAVATC
jgi:hypothetical protein